MKSNAKQALESFKDSVSNISYAEDVRSAVDKVLKLGIEPLEVVNALSEALDDVGKRYERGEYFLSELIMAGVLATEVTNMLDPYLRGTEIKTLGTVIIGTVKGDIHDIGKNIVIMMLRSARFKVVDLGIDVSAEKFAEAVKKEKADVLGMSALLTSTMNEMKNVVLALKEKGLRNQVKVMVGGRPLTKEFSDEIGADGYADDAVGAVKVARELVVAKEG